MTAVTADGRRRTVIERVSPCVDGGRFPAKRCAGDVVTVEADIFADGHDQLRAVLLARKRGAAAWTESEMDALPNDRWRGAFSVAEVGTYEYTVTAWVDHFKSWRHDLARWVATEDIALALQAGAALIVALARRARGADAKALREWARRVRGADPVDTRRAAALDAALAEIAGRYADRSLATTLEPALKLVVDPPRARFSSWYEMFPRSAGDGLVSATFADCEARLPYIVDMGFDVLYFPPIHPIGLSRRKGKNNALVATLSDCGSPWAIGGSDGGHTAVHRDLGTIEDFRQLLAAAHAVGVDIALDIALQCSPDHPYIAAHPEWFRQRPDGTLQFAENPPKKYEDIYPFDFENEDWRGLWREVKAIFDYWIAQGVRIFRVDNPHTKPFALWEWLIDEIKQTHPDAIFLAEAFTRPKIMHRLAKAGFTQSYTYFSWRNSKAELTAYFTELSQSESRDYFRPNAWPNTPDILPEPLQIGGRPAFIARAVLAGTLAANFGVYGPAFELQEHVPREPGSEEYLDSEKYQLRHWDLKRATSLAPLLTRLNRIRREQPALQQDWRLDFQATDNDQLLCYAKSTPDLANIVITIVNLDYHHVQSGWVTLDLERLAIAVDKPFQVHDLLNDARYIWIGARNYVQLDPGFSPAHIFVVRRQSRQEQNFDYYA
ncbi:MAG TPA: alpha-1,4-glucan--maltose-1-phosphate maltosyltransferase [Casimicrobiaceae bacterium]